MPANPGAVRHRRHDGAVRRHRPRAAGGDADGRRDDRQPVAAGARDDRRGDVDRASSATRRSTAASCPTAPTRRRTACASASRSSRPCWCATRRCAPAPTVRADAPLSAAAPHLDAGDIGGLVALGARGEVVGTLTRDQVEAAPPATRAGRAAPRPAQRPAPRPRPGRDDGRGPRKADRAGRKLGARRGQRQAARAPAGARHHRHVQGHAAAQRPPRHGAHRRHRALRGAVEPNSPLAGKALREAGLPRNTLVVSIARDGSTMFPRADTRLAAGDVIMVMAEPRSEQALRTFLEGTSCLLPPTPAPLAAPP